MKELIVTIHLPQTGKMLEKIFSFFNDLLSDVDVTCNKEGDLVVHGGVEDR